LVDATKHAAIAISRRPLTRDAILIAISTIYACIGDWEAQISKSSHRTYVITYKALPSISWSTTVAI